MTQKSVSHPLPIPPHFAPERVGEIWRVSYQERADEARRWAEQHAIPPASADETRMALVTIDLQNTFCIPGFELFVSGRSGLGAVEDNRRLCEFIYRNLTSISHITATLDTHQSMQIFHPVFLIDEHGNHPQPFTLVTYEEVESGRWQFNPDIANSLGITPEYGQKFILHYTYQLKSRRKYDLTIWPYHAMLGGIGHALVPAVEEAIFFHSHARSSQPEFEIKGENPLTEHYSAIGPEVVTGPGGERIAGNNEKFVQLLRQFDRIVIAGQAKSHCVAWTLEDLLEEIQLVEPGMARKIYLLEDCTSPVVIGEIVDYTDQANEAFRRFEQAGMHLVQSTQPIGSWPE